MKRGTFKDVVWIQEDKATKENLEGGRECTFGLLSQVMDCNKLLLGFGCNICLFESPKAY